MCLLGERLWPRSKASELTNVLNPRDYAGNFTLSSNMLTSFALKKRGDGHKYSKDVWAGKCWCIRTHQHVQDCSRCRYKMFLKKIREQVAAFYIPSVPRARVPSATKSENFRIRNEVMAEWVAAAGPPFRSALS